MYSRFVSAIYSRPYNSSDIQARKARRRVAPMAQELLFGDLANGNDDMSRSYTIQDAANSTTANKGSLIPLARVPSAPGSLKDHAKWVEISACYYYRARHTTVEAAAEYGQRDL